MNGKSVKLLFAQADKNVLAPILEALGAKGINVSEGSPEGDEILLAALSENFYADKSLTDGSRMTSRTRSMRGISYR